ncbi:oxaloacetate decarboxylase subunit gamma, partial [Vibrio sp. 1403]|nr:oxaloacetate decarboxylase subunit gamma [Vibrio sp. 1403]
PIAAPKTNTTVQSTSSAVSPQVVVAISAAIHQHRASIAK